MTPPKRSPRPTTPHATAPSPRPGEAERSAVVPELPPRFSRRTALTSAAAALAAVAVPGTARATAPKLGQGHLGDRRSRQAASGSGGKGTAPDTTVVFRSRPDLRPPVVETTTVQTPWAGFVFVSPTGPLMLDNAGHPVCIHPVPHAATNFQVQHYQGRPVLTWWQGEIASYGVGLRGHDVIMDTSYNVVAVGMAVRTGFETAIPVTSDVAWLKARALDASGATIGQSPVIPVPG